MVRWRIHASALEAVLVMISEYARTQFSLTIYESTGAVCADESKRQLCKQFWWWFPSRRRLNFLKYLWVNRGCVRWWIHASSLEAFYVMNSEAAGTQFSLNIFEHTGTVCADESKRQLCKQFWWWFLWHRLRFPWLFVSQQGLCALTNPCVGSWSCFCDEFWGDMDSIPWIFPSKQWLCELTNPRVISASSFVDDFWFGIDWVFLDYLKVHSGCVRWRIHTSAMEAISVT